MWKSIARGVSMLMLCCCCLVACSQKMSKNVEWFSGTRAHVLAQVVWNENLHRIEKLVSADSSLLSVTNERTGSNVLIMAINTERYSSFEKLLELGSNPNFVNPRTYKSVLMESIRNFGGGSKWRFDHRYASLLLDYGADPNYAIEDDTLSPEGYHIDATSVLSEAARLDLGMVKLLIKHGADPFVKIGKKKFTAFSKAMGSTTVKRVKPEIIYYFIDSLKVNVHEPMSRVMRQPENKLIIYHIQDYIISKYLYTKIMGDSVKLSCYKDEGMDELYKEEWKLIQKLQSLGVDFKDYDYQMYPFGKEELYRWYDCMPNCKK